MMKLVSFVPTSESEREDETTSERVQRAALGCAKEHERLLATSGGEPHSVMDYIEMSDKGIVVVVLGPSTETETRGFLRDLADHPQLFDENEQVEGDSYR